VPRQHVGLAGLDQRQVSGPETTPALENRLAAYGAAFKPHLKWRSNMSITRRIFVTGLAAVLAVFRLPDVLASEKVNTPNDEYDDYDFDAPIEYLEVGECEDMLGGPATEPGWYLHPECMIGCCDSQGPFPSREAAVAADRIRWEEIANSPRSGTDMELDTEETLFF
jgi:hypothetical protein